MQIVMWVLSVGYFFLIVAVARSASRRNIGQKEQEVLFARETYQNNIKEKEKIESKMKELDVEAAEIFTLYKMTKEITKNFSEQDAFAEFKNQLQANVTFSDVQLLDPLSPEVRQLKKDKTCLIFTLKGKRRLLGYLSIKGFAAEEKEKISILANQFTLALRRIRLVQELERSAITDSLTELHTRRYILERFEEELNRSKLRKINLSFLMIDVDHFKSFNDRYGHLAGDQILRKISDIVKENIREIDVAGRFGGEEFCVVLPDTDQAGALYVAERIRTSVEESTLKVYDAQIKATLSIGLANFPKHAQKMDELLDKADWALYRAKKMGRNVTCIFGAYKR